MRPRSGLALRHGVTVLNSPGTIDCDYRGEVGVLLANLGEAPFAIERGERIAQLVFQRVERIGLVELRALRRRGAAPAASARREAKAANATTKPRSARAQTHDEITPLTGSHITTR